MAYNSDVRKQIQIPESNKFVEIQGDTRFPVISVTRFQEPNAPGLRPLSSIETYSKYAVLTHIVNASDINISLSSSGLNIGDVGLVDHTSGFNVYGQIVRTATVSGVEVGALRVLTQDLESSIDDVTIGDRAGNYASVVGSLCALRTYTVNPLSSIAINNSLTATITNPVTAVSITNPVTAVSITTTQTLPVSGSVSVTVVNPASAAALVSYADGPQMDQSSRLRVAGLANQWWYTSSVDKDGDVRYNEAFVNPATPTFVHGASSRFVQNLGSVNMTSGLSATGSAIRASRRRHKVIPGLSHEYLGSWNFDGQQTNVIKRMGMFTNFNGYFFELSGTDFNVVVRRRLPDGTLVEERVNVKDFNGDKLDGNGPSLENWNNLTTIAAITGYVSTTPISIGETVVYNVVYGLSAGQAGNFRQGTKATFSGITPVTYNQVGTIIKSDTTTGRLTACYTINPNTYSSLVTSPSSIVQTAYHMQHSYWIDFLGGRTNRVRFGKASDYGNIVLHTFRFDGLLGTAYENAPALMDRKEIVNFGAVSGTPSFTVMGNSFNIEAEAALSPNFTIAHNDTGVTFSNTPGQERPILGVGLRTGEPYQRADLQVQSISLLDTANAGAAGNKAIQYGAFAWRLVLNPGLSGVPAPTNIGKASRHWEYTTSSALTGGGIELTGGLYVSSATNEVKTALNFFNMGSNIDYTDADVVVLMVKQIGVAATDPPNVVAQMNLIEAL